MKINKLLFALFLSFSFALVACQNNNIEGNEENDEEIQEYNTINYQSEFGRFFYEEYFMATNSMTFNPQYRATIYEAEQAQLSDNIQLEYNDSFSKGAIVAYFDAGESVSFLIESTKECKVLFKLALATGNEDTEGAPADEYFSIAVNDTTFVDTSDCYIDATGGWTSFDEFQVGTCTLEKGLNYIDVLSFGGINFDYLVLIPAKGTYNSPNYAYDGSHIEVKASDSYLMSCQLDNTYSFAEWTNTSTTILFYINAKQDNTLVDLYINILFGINSYSYSSLLGERITIAVNGEELDTNNINIHPHSVEEEWWNYDCEHLYLGQVSLYEGKNDIEITSIGDCYNYYGMEIG